MTILTFHLPCSVCNSWRDKWGYEEKYREKRDEGHPFSVLSIGQDKGNGV